MVFPSSYTTTVVIVMICYATHNYFYLNCSGILILFSPFCTNSSLSQLISLICSIFSASSIKGSNFMQCCIADCIVLIVLGVPYFVGSFLLATHLKTKAAVFMKA